MIEQIGTKNLREVRHQYETLFQHEWMTPRRSLMARIVQLLELRPGGTLLDIACGNGQLAPYIEKANISYYGIDLAYTAAAAVNNRRACVGDGSSLPFENELFDYVTSIGSLEHYPNMQQGVRELVRVLKPSGKACILVPNLFGLTWTILHAWRTGALHNDGQPIQRFGTRRAWEDLFQTHGLAIDRVIGYESTWLSRSEVWMYRSQPRRILLSLVAPFIPINAKQCFVFLCRRREGI